MSHEATYGIVITNTDGDVCDGYSDIFHCSSPIVAEAHPVLEAVRYAMSSPLLCPVFSDCLTLVNCIEGSRNGWPWDCYDTLGCITEYLHNDPFVSINFISLRQQSELGG
ncbi:hypothetical protein LINPERHAP2_LOCUS16188 [Linum perenne]